MQVCVLTEKGRKGAQPQQSRCHRSAGETHRLGMQTTMQAHSAPADCGSGDASDLCHSANSAFDLHCGVSTVADARVWASKRRSEGPVCSARARLQPTSMILTSALTTWPPLLGAINTRFLWAGLFSFSFFLPVSLLFVQ